MGKFDELAVVKSEKMKGGIYLLKEFYAKPKKTNSFSIGGVDFLNWIKWKLSKNQQKKDLIGKFAEKNKTKRSSKGLTR